MLHKEYYKNNYWKEKLVGKSFEKGHCISLDKIADYLLPTSSLDKLTYLRRQLLQN